MKKAGSCAEVRSKVTPGQGNCTNLGYTAWKEYEIKVSVAPTLGNGYGTYDRTDDNANIAGLAFNYDPEWDNNFLIRKACNDGKQGTLQFAATPAGFPIYNPSHGIRPSVMGNRQIIKVADQNLLDFQDSRFDSGTGGFQTGAIQRPISITLAFYSNGSLNEDDGKQG